MVFHPFSEILRFAYISLGLGVIVLAQQYIQCRLLQLFAVIQYGTIRAWYDIHFTKAIADEYVLSPLWVAIYQVGCYCFAHRY